MLSCFSMSSTIHGQMATLTVLAPSVTAAPVNTTPAQSAEASSVRSEKSRGAQVILAVKKPTTEAKADGVEEEPKSPPLIELRDDDAIVIAANALSKRVNGEFGTTFQTIMKAHKGKYHDISVTDLKTLNLDLKTVLKAISKIPREKEVNNTKLDPCYGSVNTYVSNLLRFLQLYSKEGNLGFVKQLTAPEDGNIKLVRAQLQGIAEKLLQGSFDKKDKLIFSIFSKLYQHNPELTLRRLQTSK